jgi:signal transduction histidine kinase
VDVNVIVQQVVETMRPASAGHDLDVALDPAIPPLSADRDKLTQVVTNLLSNALKYSPDGGAIRVASAREDGVAHLRICDNGIGIPADQLDAIFERFTRVEAGRSRTIQGTGLGLPIAREIVELHHGRVWAESQAGAGSTFHVTLPLASPSTAAV